MESELPVEVRGLVKRYGHILAVDSVDLNVHVGDIYGFLGPNGAGKTTAMRVMLGLLRPDEGSVRLFGRDPLHEIPAALDGVAGFVEAPHFYNYLTGRKNLELLAAFDGGDATVADRRGARDRRAERPRRRQGRRLLAGDAAAARSRRLAAARSEAA